MFLLYSGGSPQMIFLACIIPTAKSSLILKSNCICPGSNLTAECSVEGEPGDTTSWNGSAFDCNGNKIALFHHHFESRAGECNNGSIVVRGLSAQSGRYTPQLILQVTSDLISKTFICFHRNVLEISTVVGTQMIATVGETSFHPNK